MSLNVLFRLWLRLLPYFVTSPLSFAYGLYVLTRGATRLISKSVRGARALDATLHCPHGHEVPVVGRWACGSCRSAYAGWIGACGVCGEGADITECPTCAVGVRLPWSDR